MCSYPLRDSGLENYPGLPYCSACHRKSPKFLYFSLRFDFQEKCSVCRYHPDCRWNFDYPMHSCFFPDSGFEHLPDFRNCSAYYRNRPKLHRFFRHFDFWQKSPSLGYYPGHHWYFDHPKHFRLFVRRPRFVARHSLHPDPVFRHPFLMGCRLCFAVRLFSLRPVFRESSQKTIVILPAPWSACPVFAASSSTDLQFALSHSP